MYALAHTKPQTDLIHSRFFDQGVNTCDIIKMALSYVSVTHDSELPYTIPGP